MFGLWRMLQNLILPLKYWFSPITEQLSVLIFLHLNAIIIYFVLLQFVQNISYFLEIHLGMLLLRNAIALLKWGVHRRLLLTICIVMILVCFSIYIYWILKDVFWSWIFIFYFIRQEITWVAIYKIFRQQWLWLLFRYSACIIILLIHQWHF